MRIRTLFCAAVAVSVAASCARVTDVTKISGMVSGEDVTEVNILVPDLKIDTTVAVKNGRFYCEIPADVTVMGSIRCKCCDIICRARPECFCRIY